MRPFDLNDSLFFHAGLGNVSKLLIVSIIKCPPVFSSTEAQRTGYRRGPLWDRRERGAYGGPATPRCCCIHLHDFCIAAEGRQAGEMANNDNHWTGPELWQHATATSYNRKLNENTVSLKAMLGVAPGRSSSRLCFYNIRLVPEAINSTALTLGFRSSSLWVNDVNTATRHRHCQSSSTHTHAPHTLHTHTLYVALWLPKRRECVGLKRRHELAGLGWAVTGVSAFNTHTLLLLSERITD